MKQPLFIAQTQPGFEAIAAQEIRVRLKGAKIRETHDVGDKNSMVVFSYAGDASELLELRTVEDVFALVATVPDLPHTYNALRQLRDAVQAAPVEAALSMARQLKPNRGGHGKLRFRLVARQIGQANFRRVDAQEAVEKGVAARTDHRWQLAEQNALEFWLTLLPTQALVALRLSDEQMRHRENEKSEHVPASLRPASAAALVWLTRPRPDDVFLDPMCGAGTLLIERAHMGRYKQLFGGDINEETVAAAHANIGPRYKPVDLREWDARRLPFDAEAVSAIAVNLPFGKQISTIEENRALYPAFLREAARVLRPRGRLVALSGDGRTFDNALRRVEPFALRETYPVLVLGQRAQVSVLERT